ncbi:MAG: hypothetical protein AEth_00281 [Candidatus Argoarchaeum ethanivorans]|uniref:Dockerin domain-containing protein n=1 Tax=Candidatus Argoarchaeum ethanivorans TaxID=2608793 RepID=A0A8B6SDK2_9EURY|nr:MAG: hypothetical protein AEth_00281 [Candidatus Argoarchaeum ethanivorans]
MNKKIIAVILIVVLALSVGTASAWTKEEKMKIEADYILSCQYIKDPQHPAYGAINNVYGDPTWVVPRENAMAILGLIVASEALNDTSYLEQAQLAADYLIKIQDQSDGAWYNHYNSAIDGGIKVEDYAKSPTQTAEVMIVFYKLGYDPNKYNAMKNGAKYLMECQKVVNKGGIDDGLLGGGKDANGQYHGWRWTHDNSYAYQALKAAEAWATVEGNASFASECADSAKEIINGINTCLYDSDIGVWRIAIDENGNPRKNPHLSCLGADVDPHPSWIQYAPRMLDLPVEGVDSPVVGAWINKTFRPENSSCMGCIGYDCEDGGLKTRKYPGFAFQAALSWFDTGNISDAETAIQWAETSTLWNQIHGGWADWIEIEPDGNKKAEYWKRFIDTSFYAIASWNGGYDFEIRAIRGDLNHDHKVTPTDAAIALRLAAGSRPCDTATLAADVSGDGHVTSLDALMILHAAIGTPNFGQCEAAEAGER